jgi:hypothetical protein
VTLQNADDTILILCLKGPEATKGPLCKWWTRLEKGVSGKEGGLKRNTTAFPRKRRPRDKGFKNISLMGD